MKIPIVLLTIFVSSYGFASCLGTTDDICTIENKLFEMVTSYRMGKSLLPLSVSDQLSFVARDWSRQMADRGRISHSGFPGARNEFFKKSFPEIKKFRISRENVAMFSNLSGDVAERFHTMWINSPGHAKNIRANDGVDIGIGITKKGNAFYATQLFGDDSI